MWWSGAVELVCSAVTAAAGWVCCADCARVPSLFSLTCPPQTCFKQRQFQNKCLKASSLRSATCCVLCSRLSLPFSPSFLRAACFAPLHGHFTSAGLCGLAAVKEREESESDAVGRQASTKVTRQPRCAPGADDEAGRHGELVLVVP